MWQIYLHIVYLDVMQYLITVYNYAACRLTRKDTLIAQYNSSIYPTWRYVCNYLQVWLVASIYLYFVSRVFNTIAAFRITRIIIRHQWYGKYLNHRIMISDNLPFNTQIVYYFSDDTDLIQSSWINEVG